MAKALLGQGQPAQYTSRSNAQNHVTLDSTAVLALQLQKSDGGVGCGSKMVARRSSSVFPKRGSEGQLRAEVAGAAGGGGCAGVGCGLEMVARRGSSGLPQARLRADAAGGGFERSGRWRPLRAEAAGGSSLNRHGGSYERRFGLGLVLRSFPFLKKNS